MVLKIEDTKGTIFNIQHYAIHDGPGIRTIVFLKGCPLRCLWCQNPESQDSRPVVFFNAEMCTGCGTCVGACPEVAIQIIDGKSKTDRKRCMGNGKCADVCPNEARSLMGRYMTARQVFEDVSADSIFYQNSDGGVTLSGGDPVAQPGFTVSILKLCREAGIHTAIETCGFSKWEILKGILEHTDLVLYDIKHMDSAKHKAYTGVANELILGNAKKIYEELKLPMLARVPIIPGYNDSPENMESTAQFIANDLRGSAKVHLLPYHRLGESKHERMEEFDKSTSIEPPSEEHMEGLHKIFESVGLKVVIGG
jgi:pyruvate formate lyase activating enzyme